MIERKTQTAAYWQSSFSVSAKDFGVIRDMILDSGKPVAKAVLAQTLIERRCREEETSLKHKLSRGKVYQPQDSYDVGAQILFPALGFVLGTVSGKRPGRNAEYGDFAVIQVTFEGRQEMREFASELKGVHKLSRAGGVADMLAKSDILSPAELYALHGPAVIARLDGELSKRGEYLMLDDRWFLTELMVPVNPVQLNIAEALIEIKGMPLASAKLLPDLDLSAEAPEEIQLLSLNRALGADSRFANVGDGGRDVWYLARLMPEDVVHLPDRLATWPEPYDRSSIPEDLLAYELEIDDELTDQTVSGPGRPLYRALITLLYPHWRNGTLPLSPRIAGMLPQPTGHATPIELVDGQTGDRMQGWVVREGLYVYGLADWFKRRELPIGAFVKLERTRDIRVIMIDFDLQRLKRQWVRAAVVKDGKLTFELRKLPISCGFDEHMLFLDDNPAATDDLWATIERSDVTLLELMEMLMAELIKLTPAGTVHAKTVYSAVNLLRRTSPAAVFALLATEPCFVASQGGYWSYDPARAGARQE